MIKLKLGGNFYRVLLLLLQLAALVCTLCILVPQDGDDFWVPVCSLLVILIVYYFIVALTNNWYYQVEYHLKDKKLKSNETRFITHFIERIRSCYSYDDFYVAIADVMEQQANCSVIYENCEKNAVMYQSPNHLSTNSDVQGILTQNYPLSWPEGYFFISENFDSSSYAAKARGFFLSADKCHLYVFCKYTRLFSSDIYTQLFEEFKRFQNRMNIMNQLTEKERISHDWEHLRDIRSSFLHLENKNLGLLQLDSSYSLEVDESSSFYSVIPITAEETLIVYGDTQRKGFTSLLGMSFLLNAVQTSEQKQNLTALVAAADKMLSSSNLETFPAFFGIVNTAKFTLTYVNAGMLSALTANHPLRKVVRLKPVCNSLSECARAKMEPVVQDLESQTMLLFAPNSEVFRTREFLAALFSTSDNTPEKTISELQGYLKQNATSENSTMLCAKIKE